MGPQRLGETQATEHPIKALPTLSERCGRDALRVTWPWSLGGLASNGIINAIYIYIHIYIYTYIYICIIVYIIFHVFTPHCYISVLHNDMVCLFKLQVILTMEKRYVYCTLLSWNMIDTVQETWKKWNGNLIPYPFPKKINTPSETMV